MPTMTPRARLRERRIVMGTLFTIIVLSFVAAVLLVVGYTLFEMSPLGRHKDHYRNTLTGERRWDPPNLEDGHY
jgi:hypothetical protein